MTVHNLYLFDRNGICLHYGEWHRKKQAGISMEEEFKLMYGMLFSMRSFVGKMSPVDMKDGFLAFQTSKYKLHYYETPSGLKVVMNTDLGVGNIRDVLHQIYSNVSLGLGAARPGARTPGFSPRPALGGEWGLGARTPGFSPRRWEGSGGWEPGLLGSLPGAGRGVGAGSQDSWVLSLALGGEWGLVVRAGGLGARTPGFSPRLWEGSGGWWVRAVREGARTPGFSPQRWEWSGGWWLEPEGAGSQDSWVL
uniref:Trafficking protein particle complex subunit n=1 Tax=Gopherus evgoodei TaxID=1825980 RepID=A0A8C4YFH2_9SAUR